MEPYYEYNKFPVKPAQPEAKSFAPWDNIQNYWEPNAGGRNQNPWTAGSPPLTTTEQSWTNRVKFPGIPPYKFVGQGAVQPTNLPSITTEGFNFNKKIGVPNKPGESYDPNNYARPMQKTFYEYNMLEKPFGDDAYHSYDYSGHGGYGGYGYGYGYDQHEIVPHKSYGHSGYGMEHSGGYKKSPWKKILKFLAAVIPIGLLISALTPTMITVQSADSGGR